jgi:hypothetical protein
MKRIAEQQRKVREQQEQQQRAREEQRQQQQTREQLQQRQRAGQEVYDAYDYNRADQLSCVPKFRPLYGEQTEAWCREQRARFAEEVRQRDAKRAEEARKPENLLAKTYENYMVVRVCYEARLGYLEVNISEPEMAAAKQFASAIERKLQVPNSKDVWDEVSKGVQKSLAVKLISEDSSALGSPRNQCQGYYHDLKSIHDELLPATMKKDF